MTVARLRSRGHPAVRATHPSTWELVVEDDLTERGTCIIGVGTVLVEGTLEGLVGPITIELAVGGETVSVAAVANPDRDAVGGGLVVRRSPARLADTLATEASVGAAGLDRAWVHRLTDPAAVLEVTVRRCAGRPDGRPQVVLGRLTDATRSRVAAEVAAADAVVVEQRGLQAYERAPGTAPDVVAAAGRVLVLTRDERAGGPLPSLLGAGDDAALEAFGLSPALAAAAAVGGTAPIEVVGFVDGSDVIGRLLIAAAAGRRAVATVREATMERLVREAPDDTVAALRPGAGDATDRLVRAEGPDGLVRLLAVPFEAETATLALATASAVHPATGDGEPGDVLDPPGLLRSLLGAGVERTTIVRALAAQPGWSRNRAYRAVLDAAGDRPE